MTLSVRPSDTQEMRRTARAVRAAAVVLLVILLVNAIVATYVLRANSLAQRETQIENLSLVLAEHASQTLFSANTALDSIVTVVATLLGADGKVINFSRAFPPPEIDLSDRDYFRHFTRTSSPDTFFSVPVQNKGNGQWVFYLARPINTDQGEFLGAVLVGVSAEVFSQFYARLGSSLGPNSTLLLYRKDFTLMTRWPFVDQQVGLRNMDGGVSIALDSAASTGRAVFTSRPRAIEPGVSVDRMISARPVAGYPFVVGVVATASLYEWDWIRNVGGIWLATIVSVAILLLGAGKLISFQRKAVRMRYLADHDALTGLPNRMLFEDRLSHALADARRKKTQCALIFVDIDHFKNINDTYGHAIGDIVLREVALRLGAGVRDSDTIGRVGGDEFVMLLPDIAGEEGASRVAEKARQALARDIVIEGKSIPLSASMGIAIFPQHGQTLSDLSNSADTAMYEAKAKGRDTVHVFGENSVR